jgi:hypothetical protein
LQSGQIEVVEPRERALSSEADLALVLGLARIAIGIATPPFPEPIHHKGVDDTSRRGEPAALVVAEVL